MVLLVFVYCFVCTAFGNDKCLVLWRKTNVEARWFRWFPSRLLILSCSSRLINSTATLGKLQNTPVKTLSVCPVKRIMTGITSSWKKKRTREIKKKGGSSIELFVPFNITSTQRKTLVYMYVACLSGSYMRTFYNTFIRNSSGRSHTTWWWWWWQQQWQSWIYRRKRRLERRTSGYGLRT